jgi:hypothetical protein
MRREDADLMVSIERSPGVLPQISEVATTPGSPGSASTSPGVAGSFHRDGLDADAGGGHEDLERAEIGRIRTGDEPILTPSVWRTEARKIKASDR